MEKIYEESLIELASSHTYPVDFTSAIDAEYGHVSLYEKGSLFERMRFILYKSSFFSRTLTIWFHGLKYYDNIHDNAGTLKCYGDLNTVYSSLGDHNKAIENYQKSLGIAVEIRDNYAEG